HAASTGNYSHAASTGDSSHAASTGNYSHAASTGNYSHAEALGKNAIAVSVGVNATAKANEHGWIVLAAYGERDGNEYPLLMVKTAKVGGPEGIKAGVTYRLDQGGEFVETEPAC
ncbi:MAG: hypothetical protein HYU59_05690, partial [Magnetospirillum gryphiswaldense]|nr:hypothetical protein [Magnetospirillum gryphiswaldense]